MSYNNNHNGVLYPGADDYWSGSITIDDIRMHAAIENKELIIRPFRKDGRTPAKRLFAKSRIVRNTSDSGPTAIVPDLEVPLCIWKARTKPYDALYLQLRPDNKAPKKLDHPLPF